jgi:hypothetical protein
VTPQSATPVRGDLSSQELHAAPLRFAEMLHALPTEFSLPEPSGSRAPLSTLPYCIRFRPSIAVGENSFVGVVRVSSGLWVAV